MATNFPGDIDDLTNPSVNDELVGHAEQHSNANDAIEALELKVGVTNSQDTGSLTYQVNTLSSALSQIGNNSDTISELLGLEGNNDLAIYGIENATNVDSFAKDTWRTASYSLQVTKGSDVYTSEILASHDGTNILVSESNIISNTSDSLFSYTFEEDSGIISLKITPVSGEISVRFTRTALKA